jgi:transglutaminase-like putative cysteine protease
MVAMAQQASVTPAIRDAASYIVAGVDGKDFDGQVRAVQQWVMHNIRYLRDHVSAETLIDPVLLLQTKAGDCDDHSMLVAALLMSIGFVCRFQAIGSTDPNNFEHVYTEVKLGRSWVSVETTENVDLGWQPFAVVRITRYL